MNEYTPPPLPSMLHPTPVQAADPDRRPLGENPDDRLPIPGVLAAIESMLRQPRRVMYHLRQPGSGHLILALLITFWSPEKKFFLNHWMETMAK